MNPSAEPVANIPPQGLNRAHSGKDFLENLILLCDVVGHCSSSSSSTCAWPRNKSNAVPGGSAPVLFCHFNAWPMSANNLDGGTTTTSRKSASANFSRRFSFVVPAYASSAVNDLALT